MGTVFSMEEEHEIRRNKLLATIPLLKKEWRISFDFKASEFAGWQQVLHLTTGGLGVGRGAKYGDRTPAIWTDSSKGFLVASAVEGKSSYSKYFKALPAAGEWINIRVGQELEGSIMTYYIFIGDEKVFSTGNSMPSEFENVQVFSSSRWYTPVNGSIKNLLIENKNERRTGPESSFAEGSGSSEEEEEVEEERKKIDSAGFKLVACESQSLNVTCQPGEKIHLVKAAYGRHTNESCPTSTYTNPTSLCLATNSLKVVGDRCQDSEMCSVEASNIMFGDPCYGVQKYLEVVYTCQKRASACESQSLDMSCQPGEKIHVMNAAYGRHTNGICPTSTYNPALLCLANNSLKVVTDRCNNRERCSVEASNTLFGDPCHGVAKYLQVLYTCKP